MAPRKPATDEASEPLEQTRSFRLRQVDGEDAPTRIAVGSSPRVSLAAGEIYTTSDQSLADHLAATPELEEVTA